MTSSHIIVDLGFYNCFKNIFYGFLFTIYYHLKIIKYWYQTVEIKQFILVKIESKTKYFIEIKLYTFNLVPLLELHTKRHCRIKAICVTLHKTKYNYKLFLLVYQNSD